MSPIDLALSNLLSPPVLFFLLGLFAQLVRSDLTIPDAIAKALSLYLLIAIGMKGGAAVAEAGVGQSLLAAIAAGIVLSFLLPVVAFGWLRAVTRLPAVDAAAVAGHYGSISVVTFVAATEVIREMGIGADGWMVAVAAAMEAPAILTALLLAAWSGTATRAATGSLVREVAVNGSIVLLLGAFAIGAVTGKPGMAKVAPLIVDPFLGVLCVFLLEMGLKAGEGLRSATRELGPRTLASGFVLPVVGALFGALAAWLVGLGQGSAALMITLAASASYIAVPAALRVALPEARPAVYLTLSLGITFPFNLTVGLPFYVWLAGRVAGG
jgi:hypothetical protein